MLLKENIALSENGFVFNPSNGDSFTMNNTGKSASGSICICASFMRAVLWLNFIRALHTELKFGCKGETSTLEFPEEG